MSPRDFDRDVVQSRLAVMQELLSDLSALGAITAADLGDDRMLRHAVERILSQLVELAVSINGHVSATQRARAPGGYRESFELLADVVGLPDPLVQSLRRSVGLRNVLPMSTYGSTSASSQTRSLPPDTTTASRSGTSRDG